MTLGLYRGFDYLTLRRWVKNVHGEDALRAIADKLAPLGYAGAVTDVILPDDWRPLAEYLEFNRAIDQVCGGEDAMMKLGRFSCDDQIKFYHRVAMRLMRPGWLLENSMALWRKYCDVGRWEVRWPRPHAATAYLYEMPLTEPTYCVAMMGFFERFLQLCGCRDVRLVHSECVARGGEVCKWEGTWR